MLFRSHLKTAIQIASPFNFHDPLFWTHYDLSLLFLKEAEFDDASTHIELAKSNAVDETHKLGRAIQLQANIRYRQLRLEEAKSDASQALEIFEKLGAAGDAKVCRDLLQLVELEITNRTAGFQGELLEKMYPTSVNIPLSSMKYDTQFLGERYLRRAHGARDPIPYS